MIGVREVGHVLLARFCLIRSARARRRPGGTRTADAGPAAVVLVVGGDVADRGVQPVVLYSPRIAGELGVEGGGVGDAGEVRPVALQMAEEALDVRLVGRGAGPAVVLGDRHQRHELPGVGRGHLGPVV